METVRNQNESVDCCADGVLVMKTADSSSVAHISKYPEHGGLTAFGKANVQHGNAYRGPRFVLRATSFPNRVPLASIMTPPRRAEPRRAAPRRAGPLVRHERAGFRK
ncbi:Protein of unknown function [Gryllus bimaculatus]|nr:Protein of unknown function [Gryllus bimaculatus]